MIKCKFKCESILLNEKGAVIIFKPVNAFDDDTNVVKYVLTGDLHLQTNSPVVALKFDPGSEYFFDVDPN